MNGWKDFKMEDKKAADDNEVMEVLQSWLKAMPKSFFLEGICKVVDRWTKCVAKEGGLCRKIRHRQFLYVLLQKRFYKIPVI
jgi:hypothetical protein